MSSHSAFQLSSQITWSANFGLYFSIHSRLLQILLFLQSLWERKSTFFSVNSFLNFVDIRYILLFFIQLFYIEDLHTGFCPVRWFYALLSRILIISLINFDYFHYFWVDSGEFCSLNRWISLLNLFRRLANIFSFECSDFVSFQWY